MLRAAGVVPATVGVPAGRPTVGLDQGQLEALASAADVAKVGVRELPLAVAALRHAATTVASSAALASLAGIRVLATGGIGGVHRRASETFDESSDLPTLARTPITVVCAGVKSILDVPATLERLETLGVTVVGYQTLRFPGFYVPTRATTSIGPFPTRARLLPSCGQLTSSVSPTRSWSPTRCRSRTSSTPKPMTDCWPRRSRRRTKRACMARRSPPFCSTTSTRRPVVPASRQTSGQCATTSLWRRASRGLGRDKRVTLPPVVVVGDVINDLIVRPRGPVAVGTDTPSEIERSAGGSGANQAAWLAALGTPVRFAGRVGALDAAYHREALEQFGVETWLVSDDRAQTGTIVVLVSPDGERSMFTDRVGQSRFAAWGPARSASRRRQVAARLGLPGLRVGTRSAVRDLWQAALEAGIPTSVDPSSVSGLRKMGSRLFLEWTSGASLVFPNLDEGRLLTGHREPEAIVVALLETYRIVALKLGAAGALVAASDGRRVPIGARPAAVVDCTGAGDAFCAGFLAKWARGRELDECALSAVTAAATATGQVGARPRSS